MGMLRTRCSLLLCVCACAACAGNGDGLDQNGRPLSEGGQTSSSLTATFESIQENVFTPICTTCHAGASAPQGLRLDATNSYGLLVGVASTESPGTLRVKPGDPGNSYIIQKLEGHAAVGAQMPLGGPPLPGSTIAVIRQWITDGAAQAAAGEAMPKTLQVVTTSPASNGSIESSPAQLVVNFDGELDASLISANSVQLERLFDDTESNAAILVPSTVRVSAVNPKTLLLEPAARLAAGHYRLTLVAQAGTAIADMQSRTLAANYTFDFTVTAP